MEISRKAQEVLGAVWVAESEGGQARCVQHARCRGETSLRELQDLGLIKVRGEQTLLTDSGRIEARRLVRRYRLAERLLADLFATENGVTHGAACRFDHLLHEGIEEKICILLGHPSSCPHGRPIPPGKCCQESNGRVVSVVSPLEKLEPGQMGKVAYLDATQGPGLQKLLAMGILPGMRIRLIRRSPAFVFEIGNSTYAVDREIARSVKVRLDE